MKSYAIIDFEKKNLIAKKKKKDKCKKTLKKKSLNF
jgi:hypothetical protein